MQHSDQHNQPAEEAGRLAPPQGMHHGEEREDLADHFASSLATAASITFRTMLAKTL